MYISKLKSAVYPLCLCHLALGGLSELKPAVCQLCLCHLALGGFSKLKPPVCPLCLCHHALGRFSKLKNRLCASSASVTSPFKIVLLKFVYNQTSNTIYILLHNLNVQNWEYNAKNKRPRPLDCLVIEDLQFKL